MHIYFKKLQGASAAQLCKQMPSKRILPCPTSQPYLWTWTTCCAACQTQLASPPLLFFCQSLVFPRSPSFSPLSVNIKNLVIPAGGRDSVTSPVAFSAPGWTNPGVSASPVLQPPVHLEHLCRTRRTLSVSCLYWVYRTGNITPYVVSQRPSRGEGWFPSTKAALLPTEPRIWLHSLLQGHTVDFHLTCCPPGSLLLFLSQHTKHVITLQYLQNPPVAPHNISFILIFRGASSSLHYIVSALQVISAFQISSNLDTVGENAGQNHWKAKRGFKQFRPMLPPSSWL